MRIHSIHSNRVLFACALLTCGALLVTSACSDTLAPATPTSISIISGNNQTDTVGAVLPQLVTVRVAAANGAGIPNVNVTFTANTINGVPSGTTGNSSVVTDANGIAQVAWILGGTVGTDSMTAAVSGITTTLVPVTFVATATAGTPAQVVRAGADGLHVSAGSTLLPTVTVTDRSGNPIAGVAVAWQVTSGGGSASAPTITTDAAGHAQVTWMLGTTPGTNTLTATAGTLPAVTFTATGT